MVRSRGTDSALGGDKRSHETVRTREGLVCVAFDRGRGAWYIDTPACFTEVGRSSMIAIGAGSGSGAGALPPGVRKHEHDIALGCGDPVWLVDPRRVRVDE